MARGRALGFASLGPFGFAQGKLKASVATRRMLARRSGGCPVQALLGRGFCFETIDKSKPVPMPATSTAGKGMTSSRTAQALARIAAFSRWGPRIHFESRECGAIAIVCRVRGQLPHHWILVDVQLMSREIRGIADAVIGESFLPDLALAAHRVRVSSSDQLDCAFEGDVERGGEEQVDVVRH